MAQVQMESSDMGRFGEIFDIGDEHSVNEVVENRSIWDGMVSLQIIDINQGRVDGVFQNGVCFEVLWRESINVNEIRSEVKSSVSVVNQRTSDSYHTA
jgi:hypothetical protein